VPPGLGGGAGAGAHARLGQAMAWRIRGGGGGNVGRRRGAPPGVASGGVFRPVPRPAALAAVVVLAALAIRLADVAATSYRPGADARSYIALADQISRSGDYSTSHAAGVGAGDTHGPSAYFAPGFPYFLAAVELLTGHAGHGAAALGPARVAGALVGTATAALTGLIALELAGEAVALAALALAAVYPALIDLSGVLVAENLMTALLLAATWAALRARRAGGRTARWIAAAGLLLGLAVLTHENAVVAVAPLAVAVASPGGAAQPRRRVARLGAAAALVAACALAIAPWTIRNALELHRFIPVSDETGMTLAGTYNATSAATPGVPFKWRVYFHVPADLDLAHRARTMTEPQLGDALRRRALRYIGRHPLSPLRAALDNSRRLADLEGSFAWRASGHSIGLSTRAAAIAVAGFWVLALLALGGAFTRAARAAPRWLWWIPALLWLSAALVNGETPRFREPVDPYLLVLAACAVVAVPARLRPALARPRPAAR